MFGMFQVSEGMTAGRAWLVWLAIGFYLFVLNEVTRRFKWVGLIAFTAVPLILSIFWFTTPNESLFSTHWFALAKIYSCTAGCVGFWAIRFIKGTDEKTGKEWRLVDSQWALTFPPQSPGTRGDSGSVDSSSRCLCCWPRVVCWCSTIRQAQFHQDRRKPSLHS